MLGRIGPVVAWATSQLFDIVERREGIRGRRALVGLELLLNVDLVGLIFGGLVLWSDLRFIACLGSS